MEFITNMQDLTPPSPPPRPSPASPPPSPVQHNNNNDDESDDENDDENEDGNDDGNDENDDADVTEESWMTMPPTNSQPTTTTTTSTLTPSQLTLPCILCQNSLQSDGRFTPYLLECGHLLCADCLSTVSSTNDATSVHQLVPPTSLRCAVCFRVSSLPLMKHYALIRTLLKKQSGESADIVCLVCNKQQAVIDCSDCQLPLCEDCDETTHTSTTGVNEEEHLRELIDLNTLCLEHCKGKHFHCVTCAQDVCYDCTTATGLHNLHQYQLRDEILKEQRDTLGVMVSSTESTLQAATALTQHRKDVTADKLTSKNAINQAFEQLHAALQSRRQALLQQLEEASLVTQRADVQTAQLTSIAEDCTSSLSFLNERIAQHLPTTDTVTRTTEGGGGEGESDSVVSSWNAFLAHRDVILPVDEYTAVLSRLQAAGAAELPAPPPSSAHQPAPVIPVEDLKTMRGLIGTLGNPSTFSAAAAAAAATATATATAAASSNNTNTKRTRKSTLKTFTDSPQTKEEREEGEEEEAPVGHVKKALTPQKGKKTKSVVHLGRHDSTLKFSKLKVGDKIDCLDSSNRWAEAKIVEICKQSKQLLVTYLYWGKEWDEWIFDLTCGIAPLKTHTYCAGGPLEKGFRVEVWHDEVWREGFVMEKKGDKVKVYYEDFSNTTQTKWVDVREDYIRQFGLYQKGMINEDTKKTKKTTSKHTTVEDCSEEDSVDSAALESEEEEEEEKERTAQSAQKRKKKQHPSSKLKKRKRNNASSHSSSL